jgi:predicted nucleotidyltransferase
MPRNRFILEAVAHGLGDMLDQFVFVGGTVVELYASSETYQEARETDDVDCVVEVAGLASYYILEEKLRKLGFNDDMDEDAPICRKLYKGIKVDIMPTDEHILQFTNKWYKEGYLNAENYALSNEKHIKILTAPYFIASKLEAFFSPYRKYNLDVYASHDFEDIVYILDNCENIVALIENSNNSVKTYIQQQFDYLLKNKPIIYALNGILRDDENEMRVFRFFENISLLKI